MWHILSWAECWHFMTEWCFTGSYISLVKCVRNRGYLIWEIILLKSKWTCPWEKNAHSFKWRQSSLKRSSWIVRLLEKQSKLQATCMVTPGHSLFSPWTFKIKMVRISINSSHRDLISNSVFFGKDSKKAVCWSLELVIVTCMFICIVCVIIYLL